MGVSTGKTLLDSEGEEMICGSYPCPEGYYCGKKTLNPNYDVTNFDNIFWALLNVFQCITLEGWSDIMVMYQKAFTPWTFFFFMPMVFIGAFFLLNLTLAVIQSSYSETQAKIKADRARIKSEQREMTLAAQNASKNEDAAPGGEPSRSAAAGANIGVASFFIAKRAARKLKEYWKRHRIEKAHAEAERAR